MVRSNRPLETAVPFWADRHLNPALAGDYARALRASGVVDYFQSWDQLTSWWPRALWTTDNTPLAALLGDCDSFQDAFISAAFAAAAEPTLGLTISTDAIRTGPAELMQRVLTLSDAVEGRAVLQLGAGEVKQAGPFGYRRAEGLDRLEDHLQIIRKLLDTDGLVDHRGHHWNYRHAWIGGAKRLPPRIFAMGGGPRLMKLAAQYADGFVSMVPFAFPDADAYAEQADAMRRELELRDRDPDAFTFGLWHGLLVSDDEAELQRLTENPLLRWIAATFGRFDQSKWRDEGIQPPLPDGWHYALKLRPAELGSAEVRDIVDRTTPEMVRKSFFCGTPAQVVAEIQKFVDVGVSFHSLVDMAPALRPPESAEANLGYLLECARLLKAAEHGPG
ncbi:MAG TPA: LLM class flavin-dependent oxidoreductase [Pseudonocardia sp.]